MPNDATDERIVISVKDKNINDGFIICRMMCTQSALRTENRIHKLFLRCQVSYK